MKDTDLAWSRVLEYQNGHTFEPHQFQHHEPIQGTIRLATSLVLRTRIHHIPETLCMMQVGIKVICPNFFQYLSVTKWTARLPKIDMVLK